MAFDVEGARKAGYSAAEIAEFLGAERQFDVPSARKAGYSDDEIVGHLTSAPTKAADAAPGLWDTFKRNLGLGTRDAIEGVGMLPGMLYDAARAPGRMLIPGGYSSSDILTGTADAIGLPKAETPGERVRSDVGRNVASLIPTMATGAAIQGMGKVGGVLGNALMSAPASQLAGAAGAGLAGGAAREDERGPMAQFGASLAGGIAGAALPGALTLTGRALSSAIQPFSQAGREKILAEALLRNSSDPETLATRLRAGADDEARRLPGSPVTSAVAARDPQMMVLENGLRSDAQAAGGMSPAAALRDVEAQRNANRLTLMQALIQNADDPATRGTTLRDALGFGREGQGARQAMKARTDQLYDAVNQAERFPLAPIADTLASVEKTYFGQLSGGMPSELASLRDDVLRTLKRGAPTEQAPAWRPSSIMPGMTAPRAPQAAPMVNPGEVDWRTLQNLRQRANKIAGQAAANKDAPTAAAAGKIVETIDNLGMTPEWQAATAQRRAVGEALGRNQQGANATGQIMNRDQFGNPLMPSDRVPVVATGSPGAAKQVLGAFDKAIADATAAGLPAERIAMLQQQAATARQTMRDQFAETMLGKSSTTSTVADATGNITTQLSPAQFSRWWKDNKRTADVLFTGDERRMLDRLAADFSETTLTNQARARGSDTAQNLSVGNFIARLTGGVVDPQNPLAQTVVGLGPVARWITQAPEGAMREMLVQAIRDPRFAAQLVEKATPASLERAVLYMNQTMGDRVRDVAAGALAREVPRGLAATTQDQRQLPKPAAR